MKFLFRFFVILLLLNGVLIFWHYQESGIATAEKGEAFSYAQEIKVFHRVDEIYIRHHFSALPDERLEIQWPTMSDHRMCHVEEASSCLRLNEGATAFTEGQEMKQSIAYKISKEQLSEANGIFRSIFASLKNGTAEATVLHIIDEVHEEGVWVSGLERVGSQTLNFTHYVLFSGKGPVTDLYWQASALPVKNGTSLTVYGNVSHEAFEQYDRIFQQLAVPSVTMVVNEAGPTLVSERFLISPADQLKTVFQTFLKNQFFLKYEGEPSDQFTAETVMALLLNMDEKETPLMAEEAIGELQNALSPAQRTAFKEQLQQASGQAMTAEIADAILEEVTSYATSYFKRNGQLENGHYPFILENPKEILVKDDVPTGKRALVIEGRNYYPIESLMAKLGYDISKNEHSLYIESVENNYRFPLERKFYVMNDRRFNMRSMPFIQIEDEVYFEETAMYIIFNLKMEESEDRILIVQ